MTSAHTMESSSRPETVSLSFDRIAIIADDLTGACDSGVAYLVSGRQVRVVLDASRLDLHQLQQAEQPGQKAVWAFTTETRDVSAESAATRVNDCLTALGSFEQHLLLFKKVDSAARGHFGMEISAALRSSGAALALVAPAFPEAGRTVQDGVLHVRDWSGQDVAKPLRDLFAQEERAGIDELPPGSEDDLERRITLAVANGTRILLCDSHSPADLHHLAAAALRVRQPILWVGSAGLAHALAGLLPDSPNVAATEAMCRTGRTLLFAGSPHPVTRLQIAHLEQSPTETTRAIHRVSCTSASEHEVVTAFTAEPTAALILTGGDTAAFVLQSLGASSIELAGEVARGIPWGFVEGGLADGCIVVTKSGGFGERDALAHSFEFCEGRTRESA